MPTKRRTIGKNGNTQDIKAIIFDLDGVLVNSEPLWERMTRMYLKKKYIHLPGDFKAYVNKHFRGTGQPAINRYLKRHFRIKDSLKIIDREKMQMILHLFRKHLAYSSTTHTILQKLAKKYRIALVSSGPQSTVDYVITLLRVRPFFSCILTEKDVSEQKPSPHIFRKALKKLRVAPSDCIVVEDSFAGITAAKRAKMKCILLRRPYNTKWLSKADYHVKRLSQIPSLLKSI
ncbi:HAD family hydrolase [Patescibacteria group bacterium]